MYGYIYKITDLTNGKCYIGQHKYDKPMLDPYYHGSGRIISRIYKNRPDTLLEEILMICATFEEANYFEQYFIDRMNTMSPHGYNLQTGGKTHKPSMETRNKQSNSHKGKHHSQETCQKMSQTRKGKQHNEEWRSHIKESLQDNAKLKGRIPWNKGIPMLPHVKEALRQANINKKPEDLYNYIPIPYDCLYDLYIIQQKPCKEIASILGIDITTVYKKLHKYGIKISNKKNF